MTVQSRWLRSPKQRYLVIGVSVYVFELLVIVAAQRLGAGSVLAVGLSFWLGLIVSFGLQKLVTFGDKRRHRKVIIAQVAAFSLLVLFNFGFTLLVTKLLASVVPAVVCRTLALGITTIWNFYLYKTHIFAQKSAAKRRRKVRRRWLTLVKRLRKQRKQLLKRYRKWRSKPGIKRLRKYAGRPGVGKAYLVFCLAVLLGTTLLWSLLGAHLQQGNADQLVNARLFAHGSTLQGAVFPDQHSFLIKWPLFYFITLLGYTAASYLWVTVLSTVLTVAAFVFVLSRIERRPLALGSLCLLLASVLLLVPAQPYAGAMLPANMAMLTTRNLEYVLYLAGLVCLVKAPGVRSRQLLGATILLGLLIASDKLFLSTSVLGALLAVVCYALRGRWELARLSARWLLAAVGAAVMAALVIASINHAHITHITGSQAGPYGLGGSVKSIVLGIIFAIGGLLTNFGANPAYDATTLRQIPHRLFDHLLAPAGPAYVINLIILLFCLYVGIRFLLKTLDIPKQKVAPEQQAVNRLTALLLWSGVAVIGLFIGANHYYPVDARYLTLCLFGLFVALAAWLRPRRLDAELVAVCLPVLLLGIVCGMIGSIQTYTVQNRALASINRRDKIIAQTLASHHVAFLAGDYWRVLPVQSLDTARQQNVLPLEQCVQPRPILTSKSWQPDLRRTSFAYLLTLDGNLAGSPDCSLQQVVTAYGQPDSSTLIDGDLAQPKELLLFYDQGAHPEKAGSSAGQISATVLPISLNDLPNTDCRAPTVMNIVAHQDDDLLFMSPDLLHGIAAGDCVRTIYVTAGDAGAGRPYWLSREQGSEAAYSEMAGLKSSWVQRIVRLPAGQYVTVASPKNDDKISLVFMHLPDGDLSGQGFSASHYESLAKLASKRISRVQTVDKQSSYSADQLTTALAGFMRAYRPAEIHTQSSYAGEEYKDHSDHVTTGRLATEAYKRYEAAQPDGPTPTALVYYIGYPIHGLPSNISGQDLQAKEAAFAAYAAFDGSVCDSSESCQQASNYILYLAREYRNPY